MKKITLNFSPFLLILIGVLTALSALFYDSTKPVIVIMCIFTFFILLKLLLMFVRKNLEYVGPACLTYSGLIIFTFVLHIMLDGFHTGLLWFTLLVALPVVLVLILAKTKTNLEIQITEKPIMEFN